MNPDGLAALARADDYEQVKAVAEYYAEYAALFDGSGNNPGDKTLEDKFFEHEVNTPYAEQQTIHSNWWITICDFPLTGQIECVRFYSAISFRSILFVFEVEGTGMP